MKDHLNHTKPNAYTCIDYREEMILAGLKKRLNRTDLSKQEQSEIEREVLRIEKAMGF